jgi:hypothetical protein
MGGDRGRAEEAELPRALDKRKERAVGCVGGKGRQETAQERREAVAAWPVAPGADAVSGRKRVMARGR